MSFAASDFVEINGIVKSKLYGEPLQSARVALPGDSVWTYTNEEGVFTLKTKTLPKRLIVSYPRYRSKYAEVDSANNFLNVVLTPHDGLFRLSLVEKLDSVDVIAEALDRVGENFLMQPKMMEGFYRETLWKNESCISLKEGALRVLKTSYDRSVAADKISIQKGRCMDGGKASDSIAKVISTGPRAMLYVDLMKNASILFNKQTLGQYNFKVSDPVTINDRPQYVVKMTRRWGTGSLLDAGWLYIDAETSALTRAELSYDMTERKDASLQLFGNIPDYVVLKPITFEYILDYGQIEGRSYLEHVHYQFCYRCKKKGTLTFKNCMIDAEFMVNRVLNHVEPLDGKGSFSTSNPEYLKISNFTDKNFWGDCNVMEMTSEMKNFILRGISESRKRNAR